jgi:lysozyme
MIGLKKLSILLVLLSVLTTVILLYNGIIWFNAPTTSKYPVRGIDVSHHQDTIDWKMLTENENISFVYIKATEGTSWEDPLYEYNIKEA